MKQKREVLNNQLHFELYRYIAAGFNYAQSLSDELEKTPSIIIRQLKELENEKYITSSNIGLKNKKIYHINPEKFIEYTKQKIISQLLINELKNKEIEDIKKKLNKRVPTEIYPVISEIINILISRRNFNSIEQLFEEMLISLSRIDDKYYSKDYKTLPEFFGLYMSQDLITQLMIEIILENKKIIKKKTISE